jgi:predicted RNA-binding Zn ribbon-like protein
VITSRIPASLLIQAPAEDLCLGFANTRYWRGSDPVESLKAPADLLGWLGGSAGVPAAVIDAVRDRDGSDVPLFEQAIDLREAIYRVFSAVATNEAVSDRDLLVLNETLAEAPPRLRLVRESKIYAWRVARPEPSISMLLAPILWSAADLLTRTEHNRIRRCANEKCQWLFFDRSKSGTRRWCDMNSCGNRAKSHRHYLKSKQT